MENVKIKELVAQYLRASAQYGHLQKYWNPKMAPYILGNKYGYHILNLYHTVQLLTVAGLALEKKASKGGSFLFIGTNKISSFAIAKYALQSQSFYVNSQWLGGTFTNNKTLQQRLERLYFLENESKENFPKSFSKKEKNILRKELHKLNVLFNGIRNMRNLPTAVIFASPLSNMIAVKECIKLGIPTIGICDTNCDPELFTYPIPANDDSAGAINFILTYLSNKIIGGRQLK